MVQFEPYPMLLNIVCRTDLRLSMKVKIYMLEVCSLQSFEKGLQIDLVLSWYRAIYSLQLLSSLFAYY